ncbi:MAG TPA: hypothetical protein DEA90_05345, partial [Opitutae bacterium]|nr:hypothetical protein [Opitutae bacterium]
MKYLFLLFKFSFTELRGVSLIRYINGNKSGVGQGYFWAIHAPGQPIVLKWINNRRHENVDTLVEDFSGILQSDGYAVEMTIPNNNFRVALNYTANQWPELLECLKHGHTRLDTNLLESKFR